jgi:hypothetical protein
MQDTNKAYRSEDQHKHAFGWPKIKHRVSDVHKEWHTNIDQKLAFQEAMGVLLQ